MATGYTLQQLQAMGAQPVTPPQPQSQQGYTLAQLQAMNAQPTTVTPPKPVEPISQIPTQVQKRGAAAYGDITGTSPESQGENPLVRGLQASGEAAGAVGDVVGGILGSIVQHTVPQGVRTFVGQKVADASQQMQSDTGTGMNQNLYLALGEKLNQWAGGHPEAAKALESTLKATSAAGDVATNIVGADVGGGAVKNVADAAPGMVTAPVRAVKAGADMASGAVKDRLSDVPLFAPHTDQSVLDGIRKDWSQPLEDPRAMYNAARKVVANNPDAVETLAENRVLKEHNINEDFFDTKDTAATMREKAGQDVSTLLRPAIEAASVRSPITNAGEAEAQAIKLIEQRHDGTALDVQKQIKNVQEEVAALRAKYPDGMMLHNLHDEGIIFGKNGGFSRVGDRAQNNGARANRALNTAFGKLLIEKAPEDLKAGIQGFQHELHKIYGASDLLQALHTKRAPISTVKKIARAVSKFGGASLGAHFGGGLGGGLVSAFGGYEMGKAAERWVESLLEQPALKSQVLESLAAHQPEAYKQVKAYLDEIEKGSPRTLRLEAPKGPVSIINNGLPIPVMPSGKANAEYVGSRVVAGQKSDSPLEAKYTTATTPSTKKSSSIPASSPKKGDSSMKGKGTTNQKRK